MSVVDVTSTVEVMSIVEEASTMVVTTVLLIPKVLLVIAVLMIVLVMTTGVVMSVTVEVTLSKTVLIYAELISGIVKEVTIASDEEMLDNTYCVVDPILILDKEISVSPLSPDPLVSIILVPLIVTLPIKHIAYAAEQGRH